MKSLKPILWSGVAIAALGLGAGARGDDPTRTKEDAERAAVDADGWHVTLATALERAAEDDRPILIYYRRLADEASRRMDDALAGEDVKEALDAFVRVKIDVDLQPEETERAVAHTGHAIQATPALQVLRSDGAFLDDIAGFLPAPTLELWLERIRGRLDPTRVRVRGVWATGDEPWLATLEQGLRVAEEEERPVLLYFRRLASDGSRELDAETLSDPTVKKLLDRFILVKVDVDLQPEEVRAIAERTATEIDATPEVWTMTADGSIVERQSGFVPVAAMRVFLERSLREAGDE